MLPRRSQIYRPPYFRKNAQLFPTQKSNTTITWRFTVNFFKAAGSPRLQSEDTQHMGCGNGGRSPEFPDSGALRDVRGLIRRAAKPDKTVKTQGAYGTMCVFGSARRGVAKIFFLLGPGSASTEKNPGPILTLVYNTLFSLPFFCRFESIRLSPPDKSASASLSCR